MPGHSAVLVLFGSVLALVGWLTLNCSGAYLSAGRVGLPWARIAVNTVLCAAAGELAAVALTRFRFGRPDASLSANGWVCGLVSSSAGCVTISAPEAIVVGLIAGALVVFAVELLELRMKVDDPAGSISVHAGGAIWGLLAAGIFGDHVSSRQFLVQLAGIATLVGAVLPFSYLLNYVLNFCIPYRLSPEAERQGADLFELGAGAYPEFMTHRDDFIVR
jgi:Amt family ammonium transporter